MRIFRNVWAWLFGCRSRWIDPQGFTFFCTLDRGHAGDHEAHTCCCSGDGRCVEGPVETWGTQPSNA